MRIKAKEVKARVKLLRNPSPVAMALVDQGACQTPFNVVKRDGITVTKTGAEEMSKMRLRKGKGATRAPIVTKMQFSKTQFETKKSVTDYLTKKGVEGFGAIEDGDDVWIVPTDEDLGGQTVGKARSTPGKDTGVTIFVAEAKAAATTDDEEEEDGEDGENSTDDDGEDDTDRSPTGKRGSKAKLVDGSKTRKAAEDAEPMLDLAKKYDWWGAYMSGETSLVDVLSDGMSYDALPPGMSEVLMAVQTAIGNTLGNSDTSLDEKKASLVQMGDELAQITVDLFAIFDKAVVDSTKSADADIRRSAKKFSDAFAEDVARCRKAVALEDEGDDGDDDNVITNPGGNDDLKDMLGGISKRLDTIETSVKAVTSRSQTRKSMSDALLDLSAEDEEEDEETVKLRKQVMDDARSSLGGRRSMSGS